MSDEQLNTAVPDEEDAQPGVLDMSDDDFLNLSFPEPQPQAEAPAAEEPEEEETPETQEAAEAAQAEPEASAEGDEPGAEEAADGDDTPEKEGEEEAEPENQEEEESEEKKPEEESESKIDFEAEYKKLLAPFKANGRDMQVESIDDARTLMQMGANYNKKMAALKPNLQVLKTLEKNDLLDPEKLNYLIDLDKKNPEAINKLIQDSGIDPLDINAENGKDYKPKTYTVPEQEIALEETLERIQESPHYHDTLNLVSNKWDDSSRKVVANNPQIIEVINEHMANGVYAHINQVIENERMLGRLNGLSDIEAYKQVGDRLHAEGKFNQPAEPAQATETPKPPPVAKKPAADPKLKSRKRAAATTKAAPAKAPAADFNPLALSDDEFEKQMNSKFL